jgi:hypothetical protein
MASILRVAAVWEGVSGGQAFSNFYWDSAILGTPSAQIAADKVRGFFESIKTELPQGVSVLVQPNVAEINDATGEQNDEFVVGTPPLVVAGSGNNTRSAPSGACITWRTSTFVGGKRLRGRTFIVPLSTTAYESNGTLTLLTLQTLRQAAVTLANNALGPSVLMKVWHRPIAKTGGSSANVTSTSVTDKAAVLTSRR